MPYALQSSYKPTGDQPTAIKALVEGLGQNHPYQTLLGVTGSGKTFTIANVLNEVNRPALILSHNKTLAAQLYSEFKQFFPNNAVHYFVSYYDYYQPEAYLPTSDVYIEKDLSINEELEKLRLAATSALLSGRKDVIVVSSVSCLYGIGNPDEFYNNTVSIKIGQTWSRNAFLRKMVDLLYSRNDIDVRRGTFKVKGDTVDLFVAYDDYAIRIIWWADDIESIFKIDPYSGDIIDSVNEIVIYPATIFVTSKDTVTQAIDIIEKDMEEQVAWFLSVGKPLEAKRISERVKFDLEMIRELGYCSGIENYSRYFDGRKAGTRPFCLLDYFPNDFLMIIDESHVTLPQIRAMYGGDYSRKKNLVEFGFRLPAAIDNRPLKFEEFEQLIGQTIFVSATPGDFEIERSEGVIVEQVIRPTGLLDPIIDVRPSLNQIDNLMKEINDRVVLHERVLVTTLTKRMAEELSSYLLKYGVKCRYIHSDIDTLERVEILESLRNGAIDVIIGVNLLREGLDLPEVSLVAILDADKEGFLRSTKSLTQTAGRAARNIRGMVIMYADKITESMKQTIEETNRRREKQLNYNAVNNITPTQIVKAARTMVLSQNEGRNYYVEPEKTSIAADPIINYMKPEQLLKNIELLRSQMQKASKELDFMQAARFRDEIYELEKLIEEKKKLEPLTISSDANKKANYKKTSRKK